MLTQEQQKWIENLSDVDQIKIIPFDITADKKFEKVREIITSNLGESVPFIHGGATSLGISGQDEIDTYIPVDVKLFDEYIEKLTKLFGVPRKVYEGNRVHFITYEGGKKIDIYLINKETKNWTDSVKFINVLKTHPEKLEEYRLLKESGNGLSVRQYYRKKLEFINQVISLK
mgnify:CR=1 FL=1